MTAKSSRMSRMSNPLSLCIKTGPQHAPMIVKRRDYKSVPLNIDGRDHRARFEASRSDPVAWEVPPTQPRKKGTAHDKGTQRDTSNLVRRDRSNSENLAFHRCCTCRSVSNDSTEEPDNSSDISVETSTTRAETTERPLVSERATSRDSAILICMSGGFLFDGKGGGSALDDFGVQGDDGLAFAPF